MKRLSIPLEAETIQQLKLLALLEKKSVSAVMREALLAYLATKKDLKKKVAEIVHADDAAVESARHESFKSLGGLYKKLAE